MIVLDHGQGEIDAGGDPGRGPDAAIADMDGIGIDLDVAMQALQKAGRAPVRGDTVTGEMAARGEQESAGTDGAEAFGAGKSAIDQITQPGVLQGFAQAFRLAAGDQERGCGIDTVQRGGDIHVRMHAQAGRGRDEPGPGGDRVERVERPAAEMVCGGIHGHRTAEVQELETGKDQAEETSCDRHAAKDSAGPAWPKGQSWGKSGHAFGSGFTRQGGSMRFSPAW